jgi:hypothetical protein
MHFRKRSGQLTDNLDPVLPCSPFGGRSRADIWFLPAIAVITLLLLFRLLPAYAETVAVVGNHPPSAATLTGRAAADLPLTIRISFALRNATELHRLLTDQQNPSSPHYHRWLTPSQFDRHFGRTPAEVRAVSDWLKGQGFHLADQSSRRITATATAAAARPPSTRSSPHRRITLPSAILLTPKYRLAWPASSLQSKGSPTPPRRFH